jgi:hypothetical protein
MKIHALSTGTVKVKRSFLLPGAGPRRQLNLFCPTPGRRRAPNPKVHVATLETILAHCAQYPTIYLPSHDPQSAARLAGAVQSDETAVAT